MWVSNRGRRAISPKSRLSFAHFYKGKMVAEGKFGKVYAVKYNINKTQINRFIIRNESYVKTAHYSLKLFITTYFIDKTSTYITA